MQVQQVFDDMYTAGLQPNIMTYVTLLSSYAELGNWQYAMQVLNHMCRSQVWFLQILLHLFLQTGLSKHAHTEKHRLQLHAMCNALCTA
jgi:pentatricopeptide repeat protein